jgi:hypothetical protein
MGSEEAFQVKHLPVTGRRLKGRVIAVEKTAETTIRDGETWNKCVFTLEVTRFSKRTPEEIVPSHLKGKLVKLVRYCLYDWHYALGIEKTFTMEETENLLRDRQSATVFW